MSTSRSAMGGALVLGAFMVCTSKASAQSPAPTPPPPPPSPPQLLPPGPPPAQPAPPPAATQAAPPPPPPGYAPAPQGAYPPGAPPPGYYPPPGYSPPPGYYPPPGYSPQAGYAPPRESEPSHRGEHLHDGFYLRMGLGLAIHRGTLNIGSGANVANEIDVKGTGVGLDFAIGGAVFPGFIIAGDLGGHSVTKPTTSGSLGALVPVTKATYSRLGVLVDWYISPTGGFHLQGGAGLASYTYTIDTTAELLQPNPGIAPTFFASNGVTGIGWNVGVGYEGWISDQWGLGGLVRIDAASLSDSGNNVDGKVFAVSILCTATFN